MVIDHTILLHCPKMDYFLDTQFSVLIRMPNPFLLIVFVPQCYVFAVYVSWFVF